MPDLLLELFSEEIPARMQAQAARDLERLVVGALSDRGLMFEGAKAFAGPRRLTLAVAGLPAKQPDVSEEKKGPRVNAPAKAIDGFLRSANITLAECQKRDDGKGEFYVAVIARKGRPTGEVLAEVIPEAMAKLPWPKSMRWVPSGQSANQPRWVRPLRGIVCTFDGELVPLSFAEVKSGNTTLGHRFLSNGKIEVRRFEDYEKKLLDAHVVLDPAQRKETILHEAKQKAFALGLELVEDEGLLEETAGLAEWPLVLVGTIEDQYMDLPPEILQTSMRTHQKYFVLRDPKTGKLANRFAVVSNMIASDGGKTIAHGNERVLRARLSDAKFFWDQDRKTKLEERVNALAGITFHAKLGTQHERVKRIEALAEEIAKKIGADPKKAKRAAHLCKADLTTGVVGEFPELQGVMGRYYALHDGEDPEVADAIRDHYRPIGASDAVPAAKVSVAVALADKMDQLTEFFGIGEKPTGSSDPFALRRAALGAIRTILGTGTRIGLWSVAFSAAAKISTSLELNERAAKFKKYVEVSGSEISGHLADESSPVHALAKEDANYFGKAIRLADEILVFFVDRLKVALRDRGTRHDLIDAVLSLQSQDDLVSLVARVEALQSFLKSDDGANLLVAYRRAANILKAEEKKDGTAYDGEPDPEAFIAGEEKALFVDLATAGELIRAEVSRERFVEAMGVMARLRKPVDAFFDKVTVNDKDPKLRANRLLLLSRLRATLHLVADFSKIEG
jgi:glycyl-tRNA synthetase beta chain